MSRACRLTRDSSSSALNDTLGGIAKGAAGSNFNPVNLARTGVSKVRRTATAGVAAGGRVILAAPGAAVSGLARTQTAQNLASRGLTSAASGSQSNSIGARIARGTGLVGLTSAASTAVLRQGTARQAEREKEREASLKGLSGADRLRRAQILQKSESSVLTGDKKLAGLYDIEASNIATSPAYRKQQQNNLQKQYTAENIAAGMNKSDAETKAKTDAATKSTDAYKEALAKARTTYNDNGKYDEVDKIDEIYKKDPSLYSTKEDIDKAVKAGLGDPENFFRNMKPEAMKDQRVALAIAQEGKLLKADGRTLIDVVGKNATGKWLFNEDGTSKGNRGEYLLTGITGQAPSKTFNYDSMTTNLAPQLKTDLSAAFDRANLNDSKRQALAQAMNRPLDARAAEALRDSAGHLGGSNVSAGAAYNLLQNGIPGAVALQVGNDGTYAAPAYGTAHSELLDRGFQLLNDDSSLDPSNRAARLQALNAVTKGMGADMLKDANSPAAATVVDAVDTNLDALMKQVQHGDLTESQKKDVSGTFKSLQGIADANNEKIASGQALSATEQKVQTMVEGRFRDPKYAATVSALTRDGSKKGKKGNGGGRSSGGGGGTPSSGGGGSPPTRGGGGGAAAAAGAAAAGAVAATVINRSGGGGGGGTSGGGSAGPSPSGGSGVRAASAPVVAAPSSGIAAATAASRPQTPTQIAEDTEDVRQATTAANASLQRAISEAEAEVDQARAATSANERIRSDDVEGLNQQVENQKKVVAAKEKVVAARQVAGNAGYSTQKLRDARDTLKNMQTSAKRAQVLPVRDSFVKARNAYDSKPLPSNATAAQINDQAKALQGVIDQFQKVVSAEKGADMGNEAQSAATLKKYQDELQNLQFATQTAPAPTAASAEDVAKATQALQDRFGKKPSNSNRPGRGGRR